MRTVTFLSIALLTLVVGLDQAQAKSDFSGTWKVNPAKSDFGPMPPPDSLTEKITHQDPSLKLNVASTGGAQGDMTYDLAYTTDGKESVNHVADNDFKSIVKWEADNLVFETKGSFGGNDFTSKETWTLGSDGKSLTVTRHISTGMGDFDMKMEFDKQ